MQISYYDEVVKYDGNPNAARLLPGDYVGEKKVYKHLEGYEYNESEAPVVEPYNVATQTIDGANYRWG